MEKTIICQHPITCNEIDIPCGLNSRPLHVGAQGSQFVAWVCHVVSEPREFPMRIYVAVTGKDFVVPESAKYLGTAENADNHVIHVYADEIQVSFESLARAAGS